MRDLVMFFVVLIVGMLIGGNLTKCSSNDIMNDSIPSIRDTIINKLIEKREMNLLYHCRYQLADIVKMINAANTTDDLNLELLKVLVGDIKKVAGEIYEMDRRKKRQLLNGLTEKVFKHSLILVQL